jgi:hypothetical protein
MLKRARLRHLPLIAVLAALAGCGPSDPFDYVKVSGKVTYEDGSPIPGGLEVEFVPLAEPVDPKTHPRPGFATMNDDGTFDSVTSYKYGDGLVRGRHKVAVRSFSDDLNSTGAVPEEYTNPQTSPLEVDTADAPFHLKVPKP